MAAADAREVTVNVYDLHLHDNLRDSNRVLGFLGIGIYHTGVVISGKEYTFSKQGVLRHPPRAVEGPACTFRESFVVGVFHGSFNEVHAVLKQLREGDFKPNSYKLVGKNCNDFSNAFVRGLLGVKLPKWITRAAGVAQTLGLNFDSYQDTINNSPTSPLGEGHRRNDGGGSAAAAPSMGVTAPPAVPTIEGDSAVGDSAVGDSAVGASAVGDSAEASAGASTGGRKSRSSLWGFRRGYGDNGAVPPPPPPAPVQAAGGGRGRALGKRNPNEKRQLSEKQRKLLANLKRDAR